MTKTEKIIIGSLLFILAVASAYLTYVYLTV